MAAPAVVVRHSLRSLINPTARQDEFLEAVRKYLYVLFGGARGGGKSYIGRWAVVTLLLHWTQAGIKNVRAGIFCNTFPELRLRQWDEAKKEFPLWLGDFHDSTMEFRFKSEYGGHVISFLNLDKLEKYKGAQFGIILVEELTLVPSAATFFVLQGSLRWPGIDRPVFMATTNPDGPGHSWVKSVFLTGTAFKHQDWSRYDQSDFHFVRALPTDNPHLPDSYIQITLANLPESLRQPWLLGSWDLFQGQRFQLNPAVHEVPDDSKIPLLRELKARAKWFGAMDYGFDNPFGFGLYAVLPNQERRTHIYKVRELNISGLRATQQASAALDLLTALGEVDKPLRLSAATYLDPSCWEVQDDGLSIAQKLIQAGLKVQRAHNARPTGWVALEQLLEYEEEGGNVTKQPQMKFFPECVVTMQQITDALWDPKKPGDILHPESFRDDSLDETRYFALTHIRPPKETTPIEYGTPAYWNAVAKSIYGNKARIPKIPT